MKSRARAIAIPRQSGSPLPWAAWLLLLFLAFAFAMLGGAHAAPATTPPDSRAVGTPDQGNGAVKPPPPDVAHGPAAGVLKPKADPDPGMTVATPNPKQFPTPVIRPPGTRGDSAQVVPK